MFKRLWACVSLALRAYAVKELKAEPKELEDYWRLVDELGGEAYYGFYSGVVAEAAAVKKLSSEGHFKAISSAVKRLLEIVKERIAG